MREDRAKISRGLLLLLISSIVIVAPQTTQAPPGEMEWQQTYGSVENDRARAVIQTADGGYALAGSTEFAGEDMTDFWFVKTDPNGVLEWNRTYGGVEEDDEDEAFSVIQTNDGGYALVGFTESFGAGRRDIWLIKTDDFGNMIWDATFGGPGQERGYAIVQTPDGGFALAGATASFGAGGYDFWLIKTDVNGVHQWDETYGGPESDIARSLIQTADGGFALAGYTDLGDEDYAFWLVKTDVNGIHQWDESYDSDPGSDEDYDNAYAAIQTSDNGFALAGEANVAGEQEQEFWLVKTDETGTPQWTQTYGGIEDDYAYAVIETMDGGFALAGPHQPSPDEAFDGWLVKTDEAGNMLWSQTYGEVGESADYIYAAIPTSDGGFALAGATESYGVGGYDFWLVKVRPEEIITTTITTPPVGISLFANVLGILTVSVLFGVLVILGNRHRKK